MSRGTFSYRIKRISLEKKAVNALDVEILEQETQDLLLRIAKGSEKIKTEGWHSTVELQISLEKGLLQ